MTFINSLILADITILLEQGLELSTPVLEKNVNPDTRGPYLLPVSQVWLLATSLPALFTMPSQHPNGSSSPTQPNCLSAQSLIAKMVCRQRDFMNFFKLSIGF